MLVLNTFGQGCIQFFSTMLHILFESIR